MSENVFDLANPLDEEVVDCFALNPAFSAGDPYFAAVATHTVCYQYDKKCFGAI